MRASIAVVAAFLLLASLAVVRADDDDVAGTALPADDSEVVILTDQNFDEVARILRFALSRQIRL
jgi:hypothetical protein